MSATQQLDKENEVLKKRLEEAVLQLNSQIDKVHQLEQQNDEMKAMLEQIQQRLDHQ
ncbi:MAG: hypothetical protein AAFP77_13760 [Bacteroidota bacterium]